MSFYVCQPNHSVHSNLTRADRCESVAMVLPHSTGCPYGKMTIHLAHTLCVRCHAPVTYIKPYRLYGVLWQPGGHKRTKGFLTLYYRPKLTFYDRNMKATSSYFILKQSLSPPMKHKYLLFLSKLRTLWIYPHI